MRFTPATSAAWIVRIARSSSGRPSTDIGISPSPMGKIAVPSMCREGVMGSSMRGRSRVLREPDALGVEVVAQALVGGVADRAGLCPLRVLDVGHQVGVDEPGGAWRLAPGERRVLAGPLGQQGADAG